MSRSGAISSQRLLHRKQRVLRKRSRNPAAGALVTLFVGLLLACHAHRTIPAVEDVPPLDRQIVTKCFNVWVKEGGPVLQPSFIAYLSKSENTPLYTYLLRAAEISKAHMALLREDEWYRGEFQELETQILGSLHGPLPSEQAGQQQVYRLMTERGLVRRLLSTVGPTPFVPEDVVNEMGKYHGLGFVRQSSMGSPAVHEALTPFHCCNGRLVTTDLGPPFSKYLNAHRYLLNTDGDYRDKFNDIAKHQAAQLGALSPPLDPDAAARCRAVTESWRQELFDNDFHIRLQAEVSMHLRE